MSAYCETCAAIGNVYWNHRLFLLHGDGKYIDVMERTLYNAEMETVLGEQMTAIALGMATVDDAINALEDARKTVFG